MVVTFSDLAGGSPAVPWIVAQAKGWNLTDVSCSALSKFVEGAMAPKGL
jgi:hypothetical protein